MSAKLRLSIEVLILREISGSIISVARFNNSKFGIDIHREFSGGNCSLEFGSLGVPLIGNINLDTQRDIFPDLSFEFNDYDGIKKVINLLSNDKDFFEEVSNKALVNTKEKYNSQTIVENFKKEVNKFL
jgi:hypothetical protein